MKNIRKIFRGFGNIIYQATLMLGMVVILMFPIYIAALWISSDYNPYFLKIDSCVDKGGVWDGDLNVCHR